MKRLSWIFIPVALLGLLACEAQKVESSRESHGPKSEQGKQIEAAKKLKIGADMANSELERQGEQLEAE